MPSEPSQPVHKVSSVPELESLVGIHVTHETPEVFWVDSHGLFQFATELEALAALKDPYFQQFLPDVDWSQTVIRKVSIYSHCCTDAAALWHMVEKAGATHGELSLMRSHGRWWAGFGKAVKKDARTAPVAICLAALAAEKIAVEINHDRVDAEISRAGGQKQSEPPIPGSLN